MRTGIGPLVFFGLTSALWLALGMPEGAFFAEAWIPSAAWLLFGAMACAPGKAASIFDVDMATYGAVAFALGSLVPTVSALIAGGLLIVARYVGPGSESVGRWTTHPMLGAFFVLMMVASVAPMSLLARRNLGIVGTNPLIDSRDPMLSHPEAAKSRADFEAATRDDSEERRD